MVQKPKRENITRAAKTIKSSLFFSTLPPEIGEGIGALCGNALPGRVLTSEDEALKIARESFMP